MREALELTQRLSDKNGLLFKHCLLECLCFKYGCLPAAVNQLIVVAGGDGTIGWVLSSIDQLRVAPEASKDSEDLPDPALVLLPLGTGNDLAR